MASNFSILVDVELQAQKSKLQAQLDKLTKGTKIKIDTGDLSQLSKTSRDASVGVKDLKDASKEAGETAADMVLSYQAANAILRKTIDIVASMTEQVYTLDNSITEFKKVSDLSGQSLENYVDKLSQMGQQVARTGSEMVDAAT